MTATTSLTNQRPDDIDRLLGEFFRGEVPTPWPTLSAPAATPARPAPRVPRRIPRRSRSDRLALAASVAALLVGGWLLSDRLPSVPPNAGSLDSGTATVPREMRSVTTPPTMPSTRSR